MKKLKFLIPILLLTIFLVGCIPPKKVKETKKVIPTGGVRKTEGVTLVLDFGEGKVSTYPGVKVSEKTVFSALKKVAGNKNLELKIKDYSFGKLIEQIGDKKNTKEKAWIYFVNGKSGEVAVDKMKVKDGDVVEWKYIKPEF